MCDRVSTGLKDAAVENGPIPLGAPRPRNAHEGPWNGLYPAGYKLVRRAPHARKGLALDWNKIAAQTNAGAIEQEVFAISNMMLRMWHPQAPRLRRTASRLRGLTAHNIRNQRLSRSLNTTEIPLTTAASRCGAVALGRTYLLPPLSSGGALVVQPWLRFHIPLIEPDMQISRIRLSDKNSRFRVQRLLQFLTIYRS